jgi:hypothetical protein
MGNRLTQGGLVTGAGLKGAVGKVWYRKAEAGWPLRCQGRGCDYGSKPDGTGFQRAADAVVAEIKEMGGEQSLITIA